MSQLLNQLFTSHPSPSFPITRRTMESSCLLNHRVLGWKLLRQIGEIPGGGRQ